MLDIALRTAPLLEGSGVHALLTRNTDAFVPISVRYRMANKANVDCFVSIHTDAVNNPDAHGFSILYSTELSRRLLGQPLYDELYNVRPVTRLGGWSERHDVGVLNGTTMRAILTENYFVTNKEEAALLYTPTFRQELAVAHAKGICKFLDVPYEGGVPVAEPEITGVAVAHDTGALKVAFVFLKGNNVQKSYAKGILWPWGKMERPPKVWCSVDSETNWGASANTLWVDENGFGLGVYDPGSNLQDMTIAVFCII